MVFFVAPEDADQGISQKIFYFHVPIALTAYACFGLGAWKALRLLWKGGERYDLESYIAIHQGTIFGALTLVTGSIWAKASWGVWWTLELEPARALPRPLPLLLRLLHAPLLDRGGPAAGADLGRLRALRRRADPGQLLRDPARERLHPPDDLHARRAADDRRRCSSPSASAWAAITLLAYVMYRVELAGKRTDANLRELRRRSP